MAGGAVCCEGAAVRQTPGAALEATLPTLPARSSPEVHTARAEQAGGYHGLKLRGETELERQPGGRPLCHYLRTGPKDGRKAAISLPSKQTR